jgi:hypothetical protein
MDRNSCPGSPELDPPCSVPDSLEDTTSRTAEIGMPESLAEVCLEHLDKCNRTNVIKEEIVSYPAKPTVYGRVQRSFLLCVFLALFIVGTGEDGICHSGVCP